MGERETHFEFSKERNEERGDEEMELFLTFVKLLADLS